MISCARQLDVACFYLPISCAFAPSSSRIAGRARRAVSVLDDNRNPVPRRRPGVCPGAGAVFPALFPVLGRLSAARRIWQRGSYFRPARARSFSIRPGCELAWLWITSAVRGDAGDQRLLGTVVPVAAVVAFAVVVHGLPPVLDLLVDVFEHDLFQRAGAVVPREGRSSNR
jgi:hypothetical protein